MSKRLTKVSTIALVGVLAASFLLGPAAFAVESANVVAPSTTTVSESFFKAKDSTLDFGRVSELDRSYTKALTLINNTEKDVIVDVAAKKYDGVGEENAKLSDWIVFVGGVTHFNIPKNETRDINVRVLVPADAKAGTQYAYITVTDSVGFNIDPITVKMDVAGDGLKYSSEVFGGWIDPVRIDNNMSGRVSVKNTGTAGFTSNYQVKIKNILGGDWSVFDEQSKEVMPGKQADFETMKNAGFGIFQVEQRVTFVNAEGRMVESLLTRTIFNIPWWLIAAVGGFILLIIIIIIVVKHHKKGKASSKKLERAEKKMRDRDIERVERAEEEAIEKELEQEDEEPEEPAGESEEEEPEEEPVEDEEVEIPVRIRKLPAAAPSRRPARTAAKKPVKKINIG